MESRQKNRTTELSFAHVVDRECMVQQIKSLTRDLEADIQNGSIKQYAEEDFFSRGNGGLRSIEKDFIEREYKVEGIDWLGFSVDFARKMASFHPHVEEQALSILMEKLTFLNAMDGGVLQLAIDSKGSVSEKLEWIQCYLKEEDLSENESLILCLKKLVGSATTPADLLIREQLTELVGSREIADNLIAAYSQEPSYLVQRIMLGSIVENDLLVRTPNYSSANIFQGDDDCFYMKCTSSDYPLFDLHLTELGVICGSVETLFKLEMNDKNEWGFQFIHMQTNDETIKNMFLGKLFSHNEIINAVSHSVSTPLPTSSFNANLKTVGFFALAATVGGVTGVGVAAAVGVSLTTTLAIGGVGVASGVGIAAGSQSKSPGI